MHSRACIKNGCASRSSCCNTNHPRELQKQIVSESYLPSPEIDQQFWTKNQPQVPDGHAKSANKIQERNEKTFATNILKNVRIAITSC